MLTRPRGHGGGHGGSIDKPSGYHALAVHFDGTQGLHLASLTAVDSSLVSFSFWIKGALSTIGGVIISAPDYDDSNTANGIGLGMFGASNLGIGTFWADRPYTNFFNGISPMPSDNVWHNILGAFDSNHAAGSRIASLYVDDVAQTITTNPGPLGGNGDVGVAFSMTFNGVTVDIPGTNLAVVPFDAADWWFAPDQFIDFTVTANRRKFISGNGKPVDLGSDGSTPTGTSPLIFFSGNHSTFPTNQGTGGTFVLTGTLADSNTSPSD